MTAGDAAAPGTMALLLRTSSGLHQAAATPPRPRASTWIHATAGSRHARVALADNDARKPAAAAAATAMPCCVCCCYTLPCRYCPLPPETLMLLQPPAAAFPNRCRPLSHPLPHAPAPAAGASGPLPPQPAPASRPCTATPWTTSWWPPPPRACWTQSLRSRRACCWARARTRPAGTRGGACQGPSAAHTGATC